MIVFERFSLGAHGGAGDSHEGCSGEHPLTTVSDAARTETMGIAVDEIAGVDTGWTKVATVPGT